MKTQDPATTEIFESLADAFTAALRNGEDPSIEDVAQQHPALAERIRRLFPMLALMEQGQSVGEPLPQWGESLPDEPLERLGDFRIERQIGRGGMGIVYEAVQESLGRRVALKLLAIGSLDDRSQERFQQEARVAAMLHHTNIVPVYGVGQHDGHAYFVMQFIEGQGLDRVLVELANMRRGPQPLPLDAASLGDLSVTTSSLFAASPQRRGVPKDDRLADTDSLRRDATERDLAVRSVSGESRLSQSGYHYWINVARVGCQIASALAHAHSQKILHRDIKPSNLILDEAGSVWVTDFGLARQYDNDRLTRSGEVVGTLRYMPPEQMSGHSDLRGDVYGLGLTLYEMLVLRPAFDESDHRRLIAQVSDCQPTPPRRIDSRIPRDLETIVLKCIDREPDKRYQSATELEHDLARFISGEPIAARRISTTERVVKWARRRPAVAALAVAATLFAVVGFAGITWQWREANLNLRESQKQSAAREVYFAKSLDAVDQMLKRVGSDMLANVPGMGEVRRQLLQDALLFYNDLLHDTDEDPALRREIGQIHEGVGTIHRRLGQHDQATEAFARSVEVFDQLRREFPDEVSHLLGSATAKMGHAQILHEIGNRAAAETDLRAVIDMLEVSKRGLTLSEKGSVSEKGSAPFLQREHPDYAAWLEARAEAHGSLAMTLQSTSGDRAAIGQLEIALDLYQQIPSEHADFDAVRMVQAATKAQLASKLEQINEISRSIALRDEAIAILQELIARSPESPELRNKLANLQQANSGILARQGQLAEASERFRQEIAERRKLIAAFPTIPDLRPGFARSLALHGSVLTSIGNFDAGRQLMEEAIDVATALTDQFPEMVSYQVELAYASQLSATAIQAAGGPAHLELSNDYYRQCHEVSQRIRELAPQDPNYEYDRGIAARNWSVVCLQLDDDPLRGQALLEEAVEVFSQLSATEPNNTDYLYQLAYTRINLANSFSDPALAAETLAEAGETLTHLIELQPHEPRYRLQLTRATSQIAQLKYQLGDRNAWEEALRLSHQGMQEVVEQFGQDSKLVQFLTISQNHLGHCLKTRGEVERAEELFSGALAHRQAFVDDDSSNVRMTRQLASSHRNLAWAQAYWREAERRDFQQALQHATTGAELDPEAAELWTCLAYIHFGQGDFAGVDEMLARCEADHPPDQMARLALRSMAYWKLGDRQQAAVALEQAVQLRDRPALAEDYHSQVVMPECFRLVDDAAQLIRP